MAEFVPRMVTFASHEEPRGLLGDTASATLYFSPPFTEADRASFTRDPIMSRRVDFTLDPIEGSVDAEDVTRRRSGAQPEHTTVRLTGPPSDVQVAVGKLASWWTGRALAARHDEE